MFTEYNLPQTRKIAKKKLNECRRLNRIIGREPMALRSPVLSNMPKTPSNGNNAEDAVIQRTDAEEERKAIMRALELIPTTNGQILYYTHCVGTERPSDYEISKIIGYEIKTIQAKRRDAYIEFAEAYKQGALLVEANMQEPLASA